MHHTDNSMNTFGIPAFNEFDLPLTVVILFHITIRFYRPPSCMSNHLNTTTQIERQTVATQKLKVVRNFVTIRIVYYMHSPAHLICVLTIICMP